MKKVCVICPQFYNYRYDIEAAVLELGFDVISFPERPEGLLYNLCRTFYSRGKKNIENKYCKKIIHIINGHAYDYILIIRGEIFSKENVLSLKNTQIKAKFILYQWDSVKNNPNILEIKKYFDATASFDINDCENYNFSYIPLFYTGNEKKTKPFNKKRKSLAFIGSFHGNRLERLQELEIYFASRGVKLVYKLYIPFLAYVKNLLRGSYIPFYSVFFRKKTPDEITYFYENYSFVLELPSSNQSGVPLRLFESLGAGKNVITENLDLKKLKLIELSPYVKNINELSSRSHAVKVDEKLISEYKITRWLQKIIDL